MQTTPAVIRGGGTTPTGRPCVAESRGDGPSSVDHAVRWGGGARQCTRSEVARDLRPPTILQTTRGDGEYIGASFPEERFHTQNY